MTTRPRPKKRETVRGFTSSGVEYESTGGIGHHLEENCDGPVGSVNHCPFHNPSKHVMVDWPMSLRETMLIERVCEHGVGHPDPDSAAYFDRVNGHKPGTWSVHGCDGCCWEPPPDPKTVAAMRRRAVKGIVEVLKD